MSPPDWQAPRAVLARYLADPGALDEPTAASLEQHLLGCHACRCDAAALADPAVVARSWADLADQVDRPRLHGVERILRRCGVQAGQARLVAATPALGATTLVLIVGMAVAAAASARVADAGGPFLLLAPLAPLAAVAVAFAATAEPAGEVAVATALHGGGLLLRRAGVVLVATFVLVGLATTTVPDVGAEALGWVLPALALALASLAAGTWWRIEITATVLAAAWAGHVALLQALPPRPGPVADLLAFQTGGQLLCLGGAALATAVLAWRHEHLGVGLVR